MCVSVCVQCHAFRVGSIWNWCAWNGTAGKSWVSEINIMIGESQSRFHFLCCYSDQWPFNNTLQNSLLIVLGCTQRCSQTWTSFSSKTSIPFIRPSFTDLNSWCWASQSSRNTFRHPLLAPTRRHYWIFPLRAVGHTETLEADNATIDFIQVVCEFCLQIIHQLRDIMLEIVAVLIGLVRYLLNTPIKTFFPASHTIAKIRLRLSQRLTINRT